MSRYTIHPSPTLHAGVNLFVLIEWGFAQNSGKLDPSGRMVGEYPSLEAAMEACHGRLLRAESGTVLHA